MSSSLVVPMKNGAVLRARFFHSHGVALQSESRSRSGVREEDGVVVFAMPLERVSVDAWGCSCLLWASSGRALEDVLSLETLRHCRLAVQQGVAEGFLLDRDQAPMEGPELLAIRVVKINTGFWARWGTAARAQRSGARASCRGTRLQ
ncbi:MAG: hypothetical protein JO292_00680 [Betaproteobacteria bacterium]|nr:hypothetical protein [Betaproteobacteria bacterium]MBV9359878.1 hypothetical protein [Betaproteobacteria bacterium]